MKRLLLTFVATLAFAAPLHARTVLESETKTYRATSLRTVNLDFTVGELHIDGTDGDNVVVKLRVHCKRNDDWCEDHARDLKLDARVRGDRLDIDVEGRSLFDHDDYWVEGRIQVPRRMRLEIDMPVGEVHVTAMENDVDLQLKVGEVNIDMPEKRVGRVHAGVAIGEATLDKSDGRVNIAGFLGRKVSWSNGEGTARVDVRIAVGEATLRLY